ncbi:MAG: rhodanese-related sulfurtransferase [Bacteroidetes bacterium]|nr:rhodanese-related sulfurtransferase [Bacteroidota bacterium]
MILHNRVNGKELKDRIQKANEERTTISLYKYQQIKNPIFFRDYLFYNFSQLGVLGRIYVSKEGINAQFSVPTANFDAFKEFLYGIDFLNGIRLNIAREDNGKSFFKLTIKVRKKIVADGIEDPDFNPSNCGKHLSAEEFNELTSQKETILVDMRNHYESEIGHFENAILPDVETFREQLPKVAEMLKDNKDKPVVMYCTGGIRCEKASAYLKYKGFNNVYQLNGGIIEYARQVKEQGLPNKFIGKNFVFDERLAESISCDIIAHCHQCGKPCDTHVNCVNTGCNLLFIQCEECASKYNHCCSEECKEVISWDESSQKEWRRKHAANKKIFSKGRFHTTTA